MTLDVYFAAGFDFPKEAIARIKELRPNNFLCNFPSQYEECDWLTVYRASTTHPVLIENLPSEISWTTNCFIALYYFNLRQKRGEKCYLYSGKIKKEDIIGYKEPWGLLEIAQLDSVEDVRTVSYDFVNSMAKMEERMLEANSLKEQIM